MSVLPNVFGFFIFVILEHSHQSSQIFSSTNQKTSNFSSWGPCIQGTFLERVNLV